MNKKQIAVALKVLVSGGLIWLLLGSVDLDSAWDRILAADPLALLGAVALFGVQVIIVVWRWQAVMQAMNANLPFFKLFQITYIGLFFNQALPSSVGGDAVRIYKVYKSGFLLSRAINGVMLDRVATVLGLVLLVLIAVPFFISRVGQDEAGWIIPAVATLSVGGIAGLAVLMVMDSLPVRFAHIRLVRGLALLATDTRSVFLSPLDALKIMVISIVGHGNIALVVYLIGVSLDLGVTWVDCMVLMPPVLLLMTLPISIAGWGVREGAMVSAFALVGVAADGALVMSILFGLGAIVTALPGGLIWLMSSDRSTHNARDTRQDQ